MEVTAPSFLLNSFPASAPGVKMRVWLFLGISVVVSVGWFASSGLMGRVRLRIRWGRMRMARGIAVPARSIVCGVRRILGV